jgi:hypothetical protein
MSFLMRILRWSPVKWVIVQIIVPALDLLLAPVTILAAVLMKVIRRTGVYRLPVSRWIFLRIGIFPIRDHYYEPLFNPAHLTRSLEEDRELPGIDLNIPGQLALLEKFSFQEELSALPWSRATELDYYYDNPNFGPGDAEYLYSLVRLMRPSVILEVGSGMSTLLAAKAIAVGRVEESGYRCRQICIEPYEMPWLEKLPGVEVIRQRMEDLSPELFLQLKKGDILFIDSSHVVRPQGDVVCAYLQILPQLASGVLVHIHDIFTPQDYPEEWLIDQMRLWNEQYLVEAFLTHNSAFRVIGAVNFLSRRYKVEIADKCPILAGNRPLPCRPGSLWLERI